MLYLLILARVTHEATLNVHTLHLLKREKQKLQIMLLTFAIYKQG
uniref:Uncharacterized protein n=1 Tax=Rhizophora mucronata TaxID=61149 RepID=A0A2P2MTH2_RHIMU